MNDLTDKAVARQLEAMNCHAYEIGVRKAGEGKGTGMLPRKGWDAAQVIKSIGWLKSQNFNGAEIYIRPDRETASALVLVDDLQRSVVDSLVDRGLQPAIVIETSRGNYQAWIRLSCPEAQPPGIRTVAARLLVRELGGDMASADYGHFGRLAGYTNRKPNRLVNGRSPFVVVTASDPTAIAARGGELVRQALEEMQISRTRQTAVQEMVRESGKNLPEPAQQPTRRIRDIDEWYRKLLERLTNKFGPTGDPSRNDWIAACELFTRGYDYDSVARALLERSPGLLSRKNDADDYIARTVGKAEIWVEAKARGETWDDVREGLVDQARSRAAERGLQWA